MICGKCGQYSEANIHRCSKIVGSVGKCVEKTFSKSVAGQFVTKSKSSRGNYRDDCRKFVEQFSSVFDHIDGREYVCYEKFVHKIDIKSPTKLRNRLFKYSRILDAENYLLNPK